MQHRVEVDQDERECERIEQDIEDSVAVKRSRKDEDEEKWLFLLNLSFSTSADQLVKALTLSLEIDDPAPIIHCEIKTHTHGVHKDKPNGRAVVIVKNEQIAERLTGKFHHLGRNVVIKRHHGKKVQRVKDLNVRRFDLSALQLGRGIADEFVEIWRAKETDQLNMELNGREKRQFALEFGLNSVNYRIEFEMRHIVRLAVQKNDENQRIITFRLRFPGTLFNGGKISDIDSTAGLFMGISLSDILLQPKLVWNAGTIDSTKWIRSVDPSGDGCFGAGNVFRLAGPQVDTKEDRELLHALRNFSIKPRKASDLTINTLTRRGSEWSNSENNNWCPIYTQAFESLDFSTRYLLHALFASFKLTLGTVAQVNELRQQLEMMDIDLANPILEQMYYSSPRKLNLVLQELNEATGALKQRPTVDFVSVRRVLVTPLRIYWESHFALEFKDHFIRVAFVDENYGSILDETIIEKRIRPLVVHGINVGGRHFVFLAYSNSQLRDRSCWMYDQERRSNDPRSPPSALEIRQSMGNLEELKTVGKLAARIGQGFSNSSETVKVIPEKVLRAPNMMRNGYCFSDGCGLIASDLADQVARKLKLKTTPSAFQIRFQGAKGMLSIPPKHVNAMNGSITLRPSMIKIEGNEAHRDLEVVSFAKPMKCFLNRQIITILSTLQIPDTVFYQLAKDMLCQLESALWDNQYALKIANAMGCNEIVEMLDAGFDVKQDRFLQESIQALQNFATLDLQLKTRIYVPKGINLIGIMDESNLLPPGHVFFQYTEHESTVILPEGTSVAVYRCPCLHPGDVQVLKTKDIPALRHLVNVVVFPALGDRPHRNELSGGDLDGDIYGILFDPRLIPKGERYPPMDYTPVDNLDPVASDDMENFFVDFIKNDQLGRIANAHLIFADLSPEGAACLECLKLAQLHSTAVDFNKTGIPAKLSGPLCPTKVPEFMNNDSVVGSYPSKKILGKIHRLCTGFNNRECPSLNGDGYDPSLVLPGHEQFLETAYDSIYHYNNYLWGIMCRYGVYDEGEVMNNAVSLLSRKHKRRRLQGKNLSEHLTQEISALRDYFRRIFKGELADITDPELYELQADRQASAWYYVAYTQEEEDFLPFLSFPWIVSDRLCRIKRSLDTTKP